MMSVGRREAKRVPIEVQETSSDSAFTVLFRTHYAELFAFAYRMIRDKSVAEELVQEVFLRLWERGMPEEVTRGYLYAATRNHALNYLARERVAQRWTAVDAESAATIHTASPADVSHFRELAEVARKAIWALPERGREIFVLRRDHGLAPAEIAEALGISVKTVETHLTRAAHALRAALGPYLRITSNK